MKCKGILYEAQDKHTSIGLKQVYIFFLPLLRSAKKAIIVRQLHKAHLKYEVFIEAIKHRPYANSYTIFVTEILDKANKGDLSPNEIFFRRVG